MNSQLTFFEPFHERPQVILDCLGIVGLHYYRHYVSPTDQTRYLTEVDRHPWQHDLKRRVQHYGYKYDYKARRINVDMYVGPLPSFATELAQRLLSDRIFRQLPDQLIVNEYLPGQGITPHVDCEPCFADTVVTISLGSVYVMDFSDTVTKETKELSLELGSALVLSGDARYRWTHGIKMRKVDGTRRRQRRVSLTFRKVRLADKTAAS